MKKEYILLSLFILPILLQAQKKENPARAMHKRAVQIVVTGNDDLDDNLKEAFEKYWTFNPNYEFKTEAPKSDKSPYISISLSQLYLQSKNDYFTVSSDLLGEAYFIRGRSENLYLNIGFNKLSSFGYFDFVEALKRFQFFLTEILEEGSWNKAFVKTKNKYGTELNDIELLVDAELMKENMDQAKFESIYPYSFKFASQEEIEQAVLENHSDKAYIAIVEEKVGTYVQYIVNAGTGKIYTHIHNTFQTSGSLSRKSFKKLISPGNLKKMCKRI